MPMPTHVAYCQIQHFSYNPETMNLSNLTAAQLHKAADLAEQIENLNLELEQITGKSGAVVPVAAKKRGRPRKEVAAPAVQVESETPKRGPKKGGMSAAGRAAIAAAQRARWAKVNALKTEAPEALKSEKPAKKRGMSAAGRAAIIAAQKARWAKARAAKKL